MTIHVLTPKTLYKVALLGAATEAIFLWLLSWVPIGEGTPPDTAPVILWLSRVVAAVHLPALVVESSTWARVAPHLWWALAFLVGYLEITLAALAICCGIAAARRSLSPCS